ncbi:hypothetical protein, partial [Pseudomonas vlassakiae]|uniref:hypothetical protein n=1 Tax=Pseudomonas vlassakiae TaxID=485888 RepID=UPI003AAEC88B
MAKPTKKPLSPTSSVVLVGGSTVVFLESHEITVEKIGQKAFGLASVPGVWTLPFIVVSGSLEPQSSSITSALLEAKFKRGARVIVRSSGVSESIDARGSLESQECSPDEIVAVINSLKQKIAQSHLDYDISSVHWIVQVAAHCQLKGHLSNERRLSEALRDWVAEAEATEFGPPEIHKIPIRKWRDARPLEVKRLAYNLKSSYLNGLRETPNKLPISRKWTAWACRKARFSPADYWITKAQPWFSALT